MKPDTSKVDKVIAAARRAAELRGHDYREQALKLYPHICARCGREFSGRNLSELTVHHRDHNHDNNPPDGSNWELLCVYCHDNEHQRHAAKVTGTLASDETQQPHATHNPFARLKDLLDKQ